MSSKTSLDKYYTPVDLAKRLINTTYELIGKENITSPYDSNTKFVTMASI